MRDYIFTPDDNAVKLFQTPAPLSAWNMVHPQWTARSSVAGSRVCNSFIWKTRAVVQVDFTHEHFAGPFPTTFLNAFKCKKDKVRLSLGKLRILWPIHVGK